MNKLPCFRRVVALTAVSLLTTSALLPAQDLYWDTNGATPGAGNPADGTWDSVNTLFSTDATGSIATQAFANANNVHFSAGSDAASATIVVSGNQDINGALIFEEGTVAISGSQLIDVTGITVGVGSGNISISNSLESFESGFVADIALGKLLTAGQINGGGTFNKTGAGTASFTRMDASVTVSEGVLIVASNGTDKLKTTTISDGATLQLTANNAIGNGSTVFVHGNMEFSAGVSDSIGNLSGDSTGIISGGAGAFLSFGNTSSTYNGTVTGGFSVNKKGAGTQTWTGEHDYTGDTTIADGTFTLSSSSLLTFYIGADGVSNQMLGTGTVNLNGAFAFDLTSADALGSWQIVDIATLTYDFGDTFMVEGFNEDVEGEWTFGNYTFSESTGALTAVPQPSAGAFLLGALAVGVIFRRRRRQMA